MKRFFTTILIGMLVTACLIAVPDVHAQTIPFLDMAVTPAVQTVAPGASSFWNVQLTNNNADPAYFILAGFDDGLGSVPDISVPAYNPTPFGQQYVLAPNGTLNVNSLFQTVISPMAGNSIYNSTANAIYDLYDSSAFNNPVLTGVLASSDWTLRVQKPTAGVPEPGNIAFLAGAAVALGASFARRRRKA